ncbi:MAG TPA: PRC-barrel domain containing protein [Polyangia bacterium]|nr:PRC-barrel domain containing protein [Polyangia bacterium]
MIASDGLAVGQVAALFLDSDGWTIESLLVTVRKDVADRLGVSRNIFRPATLEVSVHLVQSVGDAVVLSVAVDALRAGASTSAEASAGPH